MKTHFYTSAIIVAAGKSTRMGEDKLSIDIGGRPLLYYTLAAFDRAETIDEIIVVCSEENRFSVEALICEARLSKPGMTVLGGSTRQQSVFNGFTAVSNACEFVSIHDGARPLITPAEIDAISFAAYEFGAVCCGTGVTNTVKLCDSDGYVAETLPRQRLISVATPQAFSREIYNSAVIYCTSNCIECTDDSGMAEAAGIPVKTVACSFRNIKATTQEDIFFIEKYLEASD